MRHFELDAARLSSIINDGVDESRRVEPDDIQLIALSGIQRSYLKLRVPGLRRTPAAEGTHIGPISAAATDVGGNGHVATDSDSIEQSLRQYLFDKYLYKGAGAASSSSGSGQ
jgi:hypothetical protein